MARTEKGARYAAGLERAFGGIVPIGGVMVSNWETAMHRFENERNIVLERAEARRRERIEKYKGWIRKHERAIDRIRAMRR